MHFSLKALARTPGGLPGVLAALALLLVGAACRPAPTGPNVVVIVIDSLRADRLHHAGDPRPLTPRLDRLAEESTRFRRARASAPWTTPSVMTLFTGLAPTTHHVDGNDRSLHESVPTLAERLEAAGYTTGAVMPALTLAEHFGFDRGFDRFVLEVQGHARVSGPWSVRESVAFLEEATGPFFLYVHLWDVHYNYNPPLPHGLRFQAGRRPGPGETDDVTRHLAAFAHPSEFEPLPAERVAWLEGQYAGEILFTDEQVGRLLAELERLERAEDTLVIVTADHGESFQEHGVLGHTVQLYEEMQRVPLLVRWPGRIAAGRVLEQPVGLIDLAPTILDLLDVPFQPDAFEGRSRAAVLLGGDDRPASGGEPLLASTSRRARLRGLISAETAYFFDYVTGARELYDLRTDPEQSNNLVAVRPEEAAAHRRRLCERLARLPPVGEIPAPPLPGEVREALDAGLGQLGYIGSDPHAAPAARPLDPAEERRLDLEGLGCPGLLSGEPPAP